MTGANGASLSFETSEVDRGDGGLDPVSFELDSRAGRACSFASLSKRLGARYPDVTVHPAALARLLLARFSPEDAQSADAAIEHLESRLHEYTYTWIAPTFAVTTNIARLAWLSLVISNDHVPSFLGQGDFDAFVGFFFRIRAAEMENDHEASFDALGPHLFAESRDRIWLAAPGTGPQQVSVGDLCQFPPQALNAPRATSELVTLAQLEMTTDFACDARWTPHLRGPQAAGGYQDRRFRAGAEGCMNLYAVPIDQRHQLKWLGDGDPAPQQCLTYYVHPEAAEIHARFGYTFSRLEPVTVFKTSSPRSFLVQREGAEEVFGIKVSVPRFFSGVLRVIDRAQIDFALVVARHWKRQLVTYTYRGVEFWPETLACLPKENAHFGMLYRTLKLLPHVDYVPWFAIHQMGLTRAERVELLKLLFIEVVTLAFDKGILLECHAQNILLAKHGDTGKVTFVFRDNGGVFMAPDTFDQGDEDSRNDHALMTTYMSGVPHIVHDRLWRLFCGSCVYTLFHRDGTTDPELDAICDRIYFEACESLESIGPGLRAAGTMRACCEWLDREFRVRFCTTSSFHRAV